MAPNNAFMGEGSVSPPKPAVRKTNRPIDLTQIQQVPWSYVDEHVYAAIRGCSVKVLRRERQLNSGCRFVKVNGKSVRYKLGDVTDFLASQPAGGGQAAGGREVTHRGRPRKHIGASRSAVA